MLSLTAETQDQTQTQNGMYSDGRTLVNIMFEGTCMSTYLRKRQSTAMILAAQSVELKQTQHLESTLRR